MRYDVSFDGKDAWSLLTDSFFAIENRRSA